MKLDERIKLFLVRALAEFNTPQQVADLIKEAFGIEIPRQQVYLYMTDQVSEKWHQEYRRHREEFLKDFEKIPIANKSVRLRDLDRQREKLIRAIENFGMLGTKHLPFVEKLLDIEKAAQDELEGRKSSLSVTQTLVDTQLTPEGREEIVQRLRSAVKQSKD